MHQTHHTQHASRVYKAAETASSTSPTMSLGPDNTLPLEFNVFVEATFELLLAESSFMTKAKLLKHVQNVCIMYACLGVKRNDGCVGEKAKHKDAAEAYRDVVVPFFLRWAKENSVKLPTWLTFDMLGRSTMTGGKERSYDGTAVVAVCVGRHGR